MEICIEEGTIFINIQLGVGPRVEINKLIASILNPGARIHLPLHIGLYSSEIQRSMPVSLPLLPESLVSKRFFTRIVRHPRTEQPVGQ